MDVDNCCLVVCVGVSRALPRPCPWSAAPSTSRSQQVRPTANTTTTTPSPSSLGVSFHERKHPYPHRLCDRPVQCAPATFERTSSRGRVRDCVCARARCGFLCQRPAVNSHRWYLLRSPHTSTSTVLLLCFFSPQIAPVLDPYLDPHLGLDFSSFWVYIRTYTWRPFSLANGFHS
jgi:hypothetical protein